jgi:hypothetical protein
MVILLLSIAVLGSKKPEIKSIYETGKEGFEGQKKTILTIPNEKGLEITVSGEIHSSEILRIYEYNQREQGEEIFQGQGVLKLKSNLITIDDEILITLNAKEKNTRKGAKIEIKALKPEKILELVRKETSDIFDKLEKGQHIEIIDQHLKESIDILEQLQKEQDQKKISELIRQLVEKYHQITVQKKPLSETHHALQKTLRRLAKNSRKWSNRLKINFKKKNAPHSIKQQSERWQAAAKDFKEMTERIDGYNKTLMQLFENMEKNAKIFYEMANAMDLNSSFPRDDLNRLQSYDVLLLRLETDWKMLNQLKENLKTNGFL